MSKKRTTKCPKTKTSSGCPLKVKLLEGTAMKNISKKERDDRCAIWVKAATLEYEVELKNMQIELSYNFV